MSKVEEVLRSEIARLSRKEIRSAVAPVAKSLAHVRRSVQGLGKRMAAVEKQMKQVASALKQGKVSAQVVEVEAEGARMSPYLMKKLRKRIDVSQAELAKLVGVSAPAVASWEQGRAKPRGESRAALIALRGLTPKEAREALGNKKKRRRRRR